MGDGGHRMRTWKDEWSDRIELRGTGDDVRAFRTTDGREIPIPKFPEESNKDFVEWIQYLSLDELEAARQFYMDHWNWETGNPDDRWISDVIGSELDRRLGVYERYEGRTILNLSNNHG